MQFPENTPLLSIVVPVYNGETFLEKCLQSIKGSVARLGDTDRASVEVIVCDNRSTDRTLEIAHKNKLECAYHIIQTPEHYQNRTLNWRYALASAQGTWTMMLHVDDLMAIDGLSAILSACRLQATGSAVMISGRHRTFTDSSKPSRVRPLWPFTSLISGEALRTRVLPFLCCFVPFTVMRRSAYLQVNGLDESYELVQDWDLWIRLLALGDLYYCPQEFGLWRTHSFSERYAKVFAKEHTILSLDIQKLIPDLPENVVHSSLDTQLARIKSFLPDLPVNSFIADVQGATDIADRPLLSYKDAQQRMQWADRLVAMQLYWLRFVGGFRLLQSKAVS